MSFEIIKNEYKIVDYKLSSTNPFILELDLVLWGSQKGGKSKFLKKNNLSGLPVFVKTEDKTGNLEELSENNYEKFLKNYSKFFIAEIEVPCEIPFYENFTKNKRMYVKIGEFYENSLSISLYFLQKQVLSLLTVGKTLDQTV